MSTLEGMDPDQVRDMGRQMQSKADHISSTMIPAIDGLVGKIPGTWRGTDASKFKSWWVDQHRIQLKNAAEDLHGLGQSALNNAADQERTSSASGAGSRGSSGGSGATSAGTASQSGSSGPHGAPSSSSPPPSKAAYEEWANTHDPGDRNQCATWAEFRRNQLRGDTVTGNGNQMATNAGLVTSQDQVQVGSLVSEQATSTWPNGHVMVVEQILSRNPPHYIVSQMNYMGAGDGSDFSTTTDLVEVQPGVWKATVPAENGYPGFPTTYPSTEFYNGSNHVFGGLEFSA